VSKRRTSALELQTLTQRECTALDHLIRLLSQVRQSTAALGTTTSNSEQDETVSIVAEDHKLDGLTHPILDAQVNALSKDTPSTPSKLAPNGRAQ